MLVYLLDLTDITKNKTLNMIGTKILIPILLAVIFIICMQLFYKNKNKTHLKEEINCKLIVKIFKDRSIDINSLNLEEVILQFDYINNDYIVNKINNIEECNLLIKENSEMLELINKRDKKNIIETKKIIRKQIKIKNNLAEDILQSIKNDHIIFNEFMTLVNKNIEKNKTE